MKVVFICGILVLITVVMVITVISYVVIETREEMEYREEKMKGKNPTRQQKKIMQERRLDPNEWLVLKNPPTELHIQHRETKKIKVLSI